MSKSVHVALRPGERMFINGAVFRADRRVSIEIMNDASYLLEGQVMQPQDTTTPLRQVYFMLQTMIMDPRNVEAAKQLYEITHTSLMMAFANKQILAALTAVRGHVETGSISDAMRTLQGLFSLEDQILGNQPPAPIKLREAV